MEREAVQVTYAEACSGHALPRGSSFTASFMGMRVQVTEEWGPCAKAHAGVSAQSDSTEVCGFLNAAGCRRGGAAGADVGFNIRDEFYNNKAWSKRQGLSKAQGMQILM